MPACFPQILTATALPLPPLAPDQLHVLIASVDSLATQREHTMAAINTEEQARAARFVNSLHGDNFSLVRGTLRRCLAGYLQIPAKDIRFTFNQFGKPALDPAQTNQALQFNVSHSHHMAALVFAIGRKVGIDIEFVKSLKNLSGLAQHVCSPQEMEEFNAMALDRRQEAFFRLWTRKEAFIKASGQGLSMGLKSIYIGFDETSAVRHVQYHGEWLQHWMVKDLPCDANYKLAVAVETV